ncbi:hypothetical protein CRG98_044673, partial [Punica granatum]
MLQREGSEAVGLDHPPSHEPRDSQSSSSAKPQWHHGRAAAAEALVRVVKRKQLDLSHLVSVARLGFSILVVKTHPWQ